MRVRMLRARVLQDVGVERPLDIGQEYDLTDVVATSLIATQAAVRVDNVSALMGAPENKAMRPPEIKRGRA